MIPVLGASRVFGRFRPRLGGPELQYSGGTSKRSWSCSAEAMRFFKGNHRLTTPPQGAERVLEGKLAAQRVRGASL